MKPALLFVLFSASISAFSQNLQAFENNGSIQCGVGYLKKVVSWRDPHFIAILDDGTGNLENIDAKLFWRKKSVQDSIILHDSTGLELQFNSPLDFLNFMYAHGFEMESIQPFGSRTTYSHHEERRPDILSGESCYFFFRRRQ